ncbi:sulfatase [Engelhardtia mirabilis]|uniref:Lipid A phosphoethanolamine transferase n=1 Tax=Engelhardtia mirabilis TaxID=2528011 RepID=A0A518BEH6_9BACT|nr:lipid A phosphoethanolamine transferase [Planctomycetes bacterium Pla133]QDU99609.1 lipid A phosphoethanolamine transferase [Planctomycetes bacterium Pla86]
MTSRRNFRSLALGASFVAGLSACSGAESPRQVVATAIHLEDQLDTATIEGGAVSEGLAPELRWSFEEGSAGWLALPNHFAGGAAAGVEERDGSLAVLLTESTRAPEESGEQLFGGIYVDVSDFDLDDWSQVEVELRATGPVEWVGVGYNVRETGGDTLDEQWPTVFYGAGTDVQPADDVRVYRFPVSGEGGRIRGSIREVAILFGSQAPATVEFSSVSFLPASAVYSEAGVGVRPVASAAHEDFGPTRRTLYTHTPTRLAYDLALPDSARLDLALGAFGAATRMRVEVDDGGTVKTLLDETVAPAGPWLQRSVDLARWAGRDVTLSLVADAADASAPGVAFWASPTLSGLAEQDPADAPQPPNVIFYVIDGASAGYMSLYGYDRPTTPNLERIAAEGVVFEQAHSNATWTMPSTASFMTSLHHSVLGGLVNDTNPIPPNVKTMAEHFHDASFHTGVFTFNPNAGARSGLDRAVDVFRDFGHRGSPFDPIEAISSEILHAQYWDWREAYPGPYWVHFQTTDVHPPHHPPAPFAGRLIPATESEAIASQILGMRFPFNHTSASVHEHWQGQLASKGIDPLPFYRAMQDAHDEAMMYQDQRLGELVAELKSRGEWENTLLIIGSDHGHPAASYPRFGRGQLDPQPPAWEGALLGEFESHVPLIFIWSGHIEGGRRVDAPVSMIDVLPTVLELAGLPEALIAQGRSLVPALMGDDSWTPEPVVFDEFRIDGDGSVVGNLEVLDGRWGESLEIRSGDSATSPALGRHPAPAGGRWAAQDFADVPRLLLYDVEADPLAIRNVSAQHPEHVADARQRLWRLWEEHQLLAARFEAGEEAEMSDEQLEALRALGYSE